MSTFSRVALFLGVAAAVLAACSGGIPPPTSELSSGQAVLDLGTMVGDPREENARLQAEIDSLRGAVAYQDTILRLLAAGVGLNMRGSQPYAS